MMIARRLYYFISFLLCCFTYSNVVVVASESDVVTTDDEKTAIELGYGVKAYECDKQWKRLTSEDRVKKIVGTVILICFVPNQEALDAGIGLQEINNFKWETTTKNGDDLRRDAITNGKGDGVLSAVTCRKDANNSNDDPIELEGNSVCLMESMLGSIFYFDTASVMGSGLATLQTKDGVDGTVPVSVDIFQLGFSIKFKNGPDGAELTNEETKELLQSIDEHNAAIASTFTSSGEGEDDAAAAAAMAESSSGEDEKNSNDNDTISVSSIDDTQKENRKEDEGKDEL